MEIKTYTVEVEDTKDSETYFDQILAVSLTAATYWAEQCFPWAWRITVTEAKGI